MVFIDACFKKYTPYTPVWLMRQAGRYLDEYKEVRKQAGDFLSLCKNPKLASKVTLQPVEILNVDAAILFSDILVVPFEMGMDLGFFAGEGPKFANPISSAQDLMKLNENAYEKLNYVYDTIALTRQNLAKDKALIGFCGAPWTLATYMIEGEGSKTYAKSKRMLYQNPNFLHKILQKITYNLKHYLEAQIQAGVNAVMVFDSWASALEGDSYLKFGWQYCKEIAEFIKTKYPHIPVILFPKGIAGFLDKIDGNFDVFGVDWSTPLSLAKEKLGAKYTLQGNLEPCRMYAKDAMLKGAKEILDLMQGSAHIFNLGHGMLPDLPRENVIALVEFIHNYKHS
ncbi:uroporphyrinogen decarboxylase [Helicobacter sp.]|uniref:uroporphyrinogen decarboxylase n=1 Tax=Helicobacter sp. TaxID=218 RepID=UPI0025BED03B|nr:uroporphyrinogen decarboxylase [Helicobacter sp.]MCI5969091.1 uroporphyrinogen decarboxylase [Helicobacter sp.]MDY2584258.1 uroporphyrinogen decarboxylase [Helicobacter sp.]